MSEIKQGYKQTKVGIIPEDWEVVKLGNICKFYKGKGISKENLSEEGIPCIRYGELYTTYNEKIDNVFSKTNVDIKELFLSKSNDIIIPASGETAIDIATASCVLHDNIALSGDLNVIRIKENGIFLSYYLNVVAKHRIASIAQGVSVVHLYSSQLENLFLSLPPIKEQEKIAEILTTWDEAITKQTELLEAKELQKKALMQKLLSGEVRFNGFDDEWQEIKLKDILTEHGTKSDGKCEVHSVSVAKGLINQIEHLGRSYAAEDTSNYNLVKPFDIVYTKSPTGNFPYGIVKQNLNSYSGIVSPLYGVFTPKNEFIGYILHLFFESPIRTGNYLGPIVQKGAKNTMSITNKTFLSKSIKLPRNEEEQEKIVQLLKAMTKEVELLQQELKELKLQKKALMQKLLTGEVRVKV